MSALTIREDMTVDSVTVAEQCGVQHKNALELLKAHGHKLEAKFGGIAFETRPFTTMGGTQKRRILGLAEAVTNQLFVFQHVGRNAARIDCRVVEELEPILGAGF